MSPREAERAAAALAGAEAAACGARSRGLADRFAQGLAGGEWRLDPRTLALAGIRSGAAPRRRDDPAGTPHMAGAVDASRHVIERPGERPLYDFRRLEESAAMLCRLMDAAMDLMGHGAAGRPRALSALGLDEVAARMDAHYGSEHAFRPQAAKALARAQWHAAVGLAALKGPAGYFSERGWPGKAGSLRLRRTLRSSHFENLVRAGRLGAAWRAQAMESGLRWTYRGDPAAALRAWHWAAAGDGLWAHGLYRVGQADGGWHAWLERDVGGRQAIGRGLPSMAAAFEACAVAEWMGAARHMWDPSPKASPGRGAAAPGP